MRFENYKEIGRYLRNSRERQGWSVYQVANAIHVRPQYLRALEEGLLSEIPGSTYVRGYLKLYAEILKLNAEELVSNFLSVANLKPKAEYYVPEPTRKEFQPDAHLLYSSLVLVATVYLGWTVAFKPPSLNLPSVDSLPQHLMQIAECGNRFCN